MSFPSGSSSRGPEKRVPSFRILGPVLSLLRTEGKMPFCPRFLPRFSASVFLSHAPLFFFSSIAPMRCAFISLFLLLFFAEARFEPRQRKEPSFHFFFLLALFHCPTLRRPVDLQYPGQQPSSLLWLYVLLPTSYIFPKRKRDIPDPFSPIGLLRCGIAFLYNAVGPPG